MSTVNLWGVLPEPVGSRPPVTILREQAAFLGNATNNILVGEVTRVTSTRRWPFRYDFDIRAAALDDYIYSVLSIQHGVEMYPVELNDTEGKKECNNEEEYLYAIADVLSSERVRKAISSLLTLSKEGA